MALELMMNTEASATSLIPLAHATVPDRCGYKAAALAALASAGFDIPDGFVIPADAELAEPALAAALDRLGNGPVAVRSSGIVEDLPDSAHAGQYDSVLNVRGVDGVIAAAHAVRRSAQRGRGVADDRVGPMAVLVQVMVDADVAGVAFSANPLTGDREVVINATRGLGDRLLAGEATGEAWVVRQGEARRTSGEDTVLTPALAMAIAALAERVERARGVPQDIEWAVQGHRLALLQARPITVLPVAPAIEIPKGSWQKDAGHFTEPIAPFSTTYMVDLGQMQPMIDEFGFMPDRLTFRIIGHEFYMHMDPDDGGRNPPPWWVIGLAARVVPSLRRKVRAAQRAEDAGLLESLPVLWRTELKPRLEAQVRDYATRDLTALSDPALFDHLTELVTFSVANLQLHFRLHMPYSVGVYELATACLELLGWDTAKAMELLQGLSTATSAPARELADIAAFARSRPAALAVIESRPDDVVAALALVDPELADRLRAYLRLWGIRLLGPEAGRPSVAECPALFADALADGLDADERSAVVAERRRQRVAEARERLTDPKARERFDRALAFAETAYPLREDNVILTDHLTNGLFRRLALEAGRRLTTRGVLRQATDALMLTGDELRRAIVDGADGAELQKAVARRKAEHAWVRAHPGPAFYGPAPGPMPDVRGLPRAARRFNGAMLWEIAHEFHKKTGTGEAIAGAAASPGVYRGRVRVIRSAQDLGRLRPNEVLVCPETSSAWMIVFRRAGALVTDHGSTLSHSAIVAREFGLPAVVATGNATATLHDGEEVIVNGSEGTVTRV